MPFTPSHAVVALPFLRTPLVPAAIAVGAMTPDLALFTRGIPLRYSATHDPRWLPVTVLLALGLLVLWRTVLRPACRELAPRWLAARLPGRWDAGARESLRETFAGGAVALGLLALSLTLGVLSHIAWDLFTHEGRLGVELFPVLADEVIGQPMYGWLQDLSSAAGLLVLGLFALSWLRRRTPVAIERQLPGLVRVTWWMSLPAILIATWIFGLALLGPLRPGFGIAHLAYLVLPPACALWAVVTVLLALVVSAARRRGLSGERSSDG
ncbi:MAG: DUF4184 domain-containing protein [Microbacterium sp.]|uniref:DUF4184 family protein n=1 Tax=Microbacterium sp. TaxID=51671 RepID=UPI000DB7BA89|nr:DUF4184 family protein [Microbacterium sp.]PZU38886.1 MAG: DUF4184 domain-containing protein [Microbacterium sp.]